jgi:hypothetical protein
MACEHGIISAGVKQDLAEYLAFRHFFAHACAFDLRPQRLAPPVAGARNVCQRFRRELERVTR